MISLPGIDFTFYEEGWKWGMEEGKELCAKEEREREEHKSTHMGILLPTETLPLLS